MKSARNRALLGVYVMAALLLLYFAFAGVRALALLSTGTPIAVTMGVALLVLPLIGAWALFREIRFGYESTKLVDQLEAEGLLPDDLGEAGPTGKPDRATADLVFGRYQREVEAGPESWRAWARLGILYDACGDRKRARATIRTAISRYNNGISS